MGNLQSLDRECALSRSEIDRLERRLRRLGRGRCEAARSDLRAVEGLTQNPFMERVFQMYDGDEDGLLTLDDMRRMMELFTNLRDEEARCKFAFLLFDTNNDGVIDKSELMSVLEATNKRGMTPAQLQQIVDSVMDRWDPEGRGRLAYPEFKEMLSTTIDHLSI